MPQGEHELREPGIYFGTLADYGSYMSATNKPYIGLVWNVTRRKVGEDEWEDLEQFPAYERLYVSPAALEYSVKELELLGFNGCFDSTCDFADGPKTEGVELLCKHDKGYARWSVAAASSGGKGSPLPPQQAELLARQYRAAKRTKTTTPPPTAAPAAAPPDDDIPF